MPCPSHPSEGITAVNINLSFPSTQQCNYTINQYSDWVLLLHVSGFKLPSSGSKYDPNNYTYLNFPVWIHISAKFSCRECNPRI
jgi:hypothetical protein